MAVVNVDPTVKVSSTQTLSITRALYTNGANLGALKADVAVAAADDDGSTYRLFEGLDPRLRPLLLLVGSTGITGATDYDIGLYAPSGGAVIASKQECFVDSLDLSTAKALGLSALDALAGVTALLHGQMLYEHAGHNINTLLTAYDIVATSITNGSGAGTISALLLYALPTS